MRKRAVPIGGEPVKRSEPSEQVEVMQIRHTRKASEQFERTAPPTRMTTRLCREIRNAIDDCKILELIADNFNATVEQSDGSFTDNTFSFKLIFTLKREDGTARDLDEANFSRYCRMFGLDPEDLGVTFYAQGEVFRVTGMKPRSRKYPVIAERLIDGKKFKFNPATIIAGKESDDE